MAADNTVSTIIEKPNILPDHCLESEVLIFLKPNLSQLMGQFHRAEIPLRTPAVVLPGGATAQPDPRLDLLAALMGRDAVTRVSCEVGAGIQPGRWACPPTILRCLQPV